MMKIPVVFTPDDERFLRRNLRFHFERIISSAMEENSVTVPNLWLRPVDRERKNESVNAAVQLPSTACSLTRRKR